MIERKKYIWLMSLAVLFAGIYSIAQDIDEDSLMAMEELNLTDSIEGDLPVAEGNDDDLLAELLGGDIDSDLDNDLLDEDRSLDAISLDDSSDDLGSLLEDIVNEPIAEGIDVTETDVPAEKEEEAFALDDAIDDLGLDSLETETADIVESNPAFVEESEDVTEDVSMDDLLGELTAEEPTVDTLMEEEPVVAEDVSMDDILGELPAEEVAVVEEKGLDLDEDISEIDDALDMDELVDELAAESEEDLGLADLTDDTLETIDVVEPIIEDVEPDKLVEIVEEPEEYVDDMAMDDDLFKSLASEALVDIAAEKSATLSERGEQPAEPVVEKDLALDNLIATLASEAEAQVPMEDLDEMVPVAEPVAIVPSKIEEDLPVVIIAEPIVGKSPEVAAFEEAERTKRIAIEAHAINSIQNAEQELAKKDYVKSILLFEEALKYLPHRDDLAPMRKRARRGIAGASYLRALSLERMGDLENAKDAALNSVQFGYAKGEKTVKRIQDTIDNPVVLPPPTPSKRWQQPDYIAKEKEIKAWLKRGREAYLTGEYNRAIMNFESVLARDPENKEAMRLRQSASQKLYDRSSAELKGTRINMMSQVRDAWSPRRKYGEYETPIQEGEQTITSTDSEDNKRTEVIKKMKNIRIPEIDFRQANIRDVVDFLHAQSVEFDPAENPEERKGVNIILKLGSDKVTAAATAAPDPWGGLDDGGGLDAGGGGNEMLVTFSALDMTLEEALNVVVEYANLKYIIRGNMVKIMPKNEAVGEIEHRMYNVLSTAISRLEELSSAVSETSRRSGGFQAMEGNDVGGGGEVDLKVFFAEMGVPWPDNSSIKYVRGLGKLVVANTLENLTLFEKVLKVLNVVPYQIEIETRFVEVAQTDIDSLGLEWLLNDDWEVAQKKSSAGKPLSAQERIIVNANASGNGFTRGNRFLTQASLDGSSVADNLLSFTSVLTNPELTVVLHALQQKGNTDLLSAPKVTTQSGQPATIKVVTEYIYPTEYTLIESQSSGSSSSGGGGGVAPPAVEPGSFETREVGVILDVLAEVSPSGQMINLTLSPEVVTEPDWHDYGYDYSTGSDGGLESSVHLKMEMPFFHTRKLETNLLVYNGATVAMGGMITEVRTDIDDKIPILGDIPIIGRLFSSRYEASEKRNLLIFVTARLVDPSGRALDSDRFGVDGTIAAKISESGGDSSE